jgi:putative transposase
LIVSFIDEMVAAGRAVESTCRVLTDLGCKVAARTYRAWRAGLRAGYRAVADRHHHDALVMNAIETLCWSTDARTGVRRAAPESLYGRRKMTAALRGSQLPGTDRVAFCTVDRAMKALGRNGVRRHKGVRTTIARGDGKRAADLLGRDFTAPAPNHVWVTDFTYVRTWAGFAYVAFIVDVYAQRIVAWHAATSKATDLVMTPLRMAMWQREREGHPVGREQLIHHSDAGSQYTSVRFTEHLALEGIAPSIGSVGDAYDNALMESINGLYKTECIRTQIFHDGPYKTLADVEYATAGWVEWYNARRLHGSLGMTTPTEYEHAHYAALNPEVQPA